MLPRALNLGRVARARTCGRNPFKCGQLQAAAGAAHPLGASPAARAASTFAPGYFEHIGRTPMVELQRDVVTEGPTLLEQPGRARRVPGVGRVFVKLEGHNPAGSIKDRAITEVVFNILERVETEAKQSGSATPTLCLVTSGRAGITMAEIAKHVESPNMETVICVPENYKDMQAPALLSARPDVNVAFGLEELERGRERLRAETGSAGCWLAFMPGTFLEVLAASEQHAGARPEWHMVEQHFDASSTLAHQQTVLEILAQCPDVTDVVCAVGTGATAAGLRKYLPQRVLVHARPAISGQIDGIADVDRYDNFCDAEELEGYHCGEVYLPDDAQEHQALLMRAEHIDAGPSTGAGLWLARRVLQKRPDANIVVISADGRVDMQQNVNVAQTCTDDALQARPAVPATRPVVEVSEPRTPKHSTRAQWRQRKRSSKRKTAHKLSPLAWGMRPQPPMRRAAAFSTTAIGCSQGRRAFSSAADAEWREHVIVGGGPVGSATAWFLSEQAAERGEDPSVTLVHDPRNHGAHEDWSRLARLSFDGPEAEYELSKHALGLLDLVDEVRAMQSGAAVVPLRPGMLFVASPGTNLARLCEQGEGYGDGDYTRVSPDELEALYPGNEFALPPDTLCWASPRGYCVSPLELAETQRRTAQAYGAEVLEGVARVGVAADDASVFEVEIGLNADGSSKKLATRNCYLMAGAHNKRLLSEAVERGHDALSVAPFEDTYISAISTVRYKHVNHPATPTPGSGHVVPPIVLGQLDVPDLVPYEANFSIVAEEFGDVLKTRLSGAAGKETIPTVEAMHQMLGAETDSQMAADYQALFGTLFPFLDTRAPLDFNRCVTYRNHDVAFSGTTLLAHKIGGDAEKGEEKKEGTLLTTAGCFGVGVKFGPALGEAAAAYVSGVDLVQGMEVLDSRRERTPVDGEHVERAW